MPYNKPYNNTNDHDLAAIERDGYVLRESPAILDAVAGLTGNLGIEIYASHVDTRHAMRDATLDGAAASREQALAATAEQGED